MINTTHLPQFVLEKQIYSLSHPHKQPIRTTMTVIAAKPPITLTGMTQSARPLGSGLGVGGTKQQNKIIL